MLRRAHHQAGGGVNVTEAHRCDEIADAGRISRQRLSAFDHAIERPALSKEQQGSHPGISYLAGQVVSLFKQ
jgi:hypothetical protein